MFTSHWCNGHLVIWRLKAVNTKHVIMNVNYVMMDKMLRCVCLAKRTNSPLKFSVLMNWNMNYLKFKLAYDQEETIGKAYLNICLRLDNSTLTKIKITYRRSNLAGSTNFHFSIFCPSSATYFLCKFTKSCKFSPNGRLHVPVHERMVFLTQYMSCVVDFFNATVCCWNMSIWEVLIQC